MIHLVYPHRFLLGPLKYPGEIKNRDYANFWGTKKVYYGRCKNGEWNLKEREWVTSVTFSLWTLWWLSFRPYDVPTTTYNQFSFLHFGFPCGAGSDDIYQVPAEGQQKVEISSPKVKDMFENTSCLLFPFGEVPLTIIYTVHSFS